MAQVWIARRHGAHGFEKLLALKVIHSRYAEEAVFHAMFLDEARLTAAIHHPNVAQVFDLGEMGDMLYLVMEYVDGEPVSTLLGSQFERTGEGTMPLDVALKVTRDVCAGLHAAHVLTDARGELRNVVHRDVSPQNVLLGVRGEVKLIDFGIAFARDRLAGETSDGAVKGKIHYMSPEQVRHQPLGPTADVFGAGATLYAILVGDAPFAGDTTIETLQRLMSGKPAEIPAHLPGPVRDVLARSLALDPKERFASAAEMMTAVDAAMARLDADRTADVGAWVSLNLSAKARARRAELASRVASAAHAATEPPPTATDKDVSAAAIPELVMPARPARASSPETRVDAGSSPNVAIELDRDKPVANAAPAPSPRRLAVPTPLSPMDGTVRMPAPVPVPVRARAAAPAPAAPAAPAPAPAPEPLPSPEFFDVRALAARASSPDVSNGDTPRAVARAAPAPTRPETSLRWPLAAAIVLFVLVVGVLLFAPVYVKRRVVTEARAFGLELAIDSVSVRFGGVSLHGVTAKSVDAPSVVVHAADVHSHGFSGADVRAEDVTVDVQGTVAEVANGLARVLARGEHDAPVMDAKHLTVVRTRIDWVDPTGEGTKLVAEGAGFEIEGHRRDPSERMRAAAGAAAAGRSEPRVVDPKNMPPNRLVVRGTSDRTWLGTPKGSLGPWTASFEVDGASNRVRVLFDPAVPDGPSALYVWGPATSDALTVRIPRVPLATLGIPGPVVGLPQGASPDVQASIESSLTPLGRVEAKAHVEVLGVPFPGGRAPVPLRIDANASGIPGKPLDLEKSTVAVGPFVANVSGTVEVGIAGTRIDSTWKVGPIPCERLAKAKVEAEGGALAAALQDFGQITGIARVTGTATANGSFLLDTSAPEPVVLATRTHETCGLRLFGW